MSSIGLILGLPIFQKIYLADWWQPNFIFPLYYIKIEDFIFGLSITGIISSIYSALKYNDKKLSEYTGFQFLHKIIIISFVFSAFFAMFYILHFHSFWVSIFASSLGAVLVFIKKPAFIKHAVITGFITAAIITPVYLICLHLNPDFINHEWLLNELSGKMFLHIPIEEFIWYIFAGVGIAALQELLS